MLDKMSKKKKKSKIFLSLSTLIPRNTHPVTLDAEMVTCTNNISIELVYKERKEENESGSLTNGLDRKFYIKLMLENPTCELRRYSSKR